MIFHQKLDHAEVALENISTTAPQDSVRGSLMEAVKETKNNFDTQAECETRCGNRGKEC